MAENAAADPDEGLPTLEKLAVLFLALGQDTAGQVLKHLDDRDVEDIAQAIAALKHASVDVQDRVLEEFEQHLLAGDWTALGGVDYARSLLEKAVGPRRAQEILDRVTGFTSSGFQLLRNVPPDQVAPFVSNEHPQTIALILSQLEPAQAAGILQQLPEKLQGEVAHRMATTENVAPAVLKEIEEGLAANLQDLLGGHKEVGGPQVVADILNLTGGTVEKNVLDQIDARDPETAEAVRNLMFVFADIAKLADREIQLVLKEIDNQDLIIALKAAPAEVREKILGNVSARIRTYIEEEIDLLGPMRLREVEEVQLRVVQRVRQLEEQGQINITRGDDDTYV